MVKTGNRAGLGSRPRPAGPATAGGVSASPATPGCPPGSGWTSVQASNGQTYSYHYSGGTDGQGAADFPVGSGPQQVQINLICDARYQIQSVTLEGAASHDFSVTGGSDPRSRTINDTDTDVDSVEYSVLVLDTVAKCTIPCDPQIRNQPGN